MASGLRRTWEMFICVCFIFVKILGPCFSAEPIAADGYVEREDKLVSVEKEFSLYLDVENKLSFQLEEIEETAAPPPPPAPDPIYVKFSPPSLNFGKGEVGVAQIRQITIHNEHKTFSLRLLSISGNTPHFHCSFFRDKVIEPGNKTAFDVVFLPRDVGSFTSKLHIYASRNQHHVRPEYQLNGIGVGSSYRVSSLVGAKLPLNSTFSPMIYVYNPHNMPIQITEAYSSDGNLHLELPSNPSTTDIYALWSIPSYERRPVLRARYLATTIENNLTAYIRIRSNYSLYNEASDRSILLPVELEITSESGIYTDTGVLDFGVLTRSSYTGSNTHKTPSRRPDAAATSHASSHSLDLNIYSTHQHEVVINSIVTEPANPAISIDIDEHLKRLPPPPDPSHSQPSSSSSSSSTSPSTGADPSTNPPSSSSTSSSSSITFVNVATITFNASKLENRSRIQAGEIVIKSKSANTLRIPYRAEILDGKLSITEDSSSISSSAPPTSVKSSASPSAGQPSSASSSPASQKKSTSSDDPSEEKTSSQTSSSASSTRLPLPQPASPLSSLSTPHFLSQEDLRPVIKHLQAKSTFTSNLIVHRIEISSASGSARDLFSIENASLPLMLESNKKTYLASIKFEPNSTYMSLKAIIHVHTNITVFDVEVEVFNGKLTFTSGAARVKANMIDYTNIAVNETKIYYFALYNNNPVPVTIREVICDCDHVSQVSFISASYGPTTSSELFSFSSPVTSSVTSSVSSPPSTTSTNSSLASYSTDSSSSISHDQEITSTADQHDFPYTIAPYHRTIWRASVKATENLRDIYTGEYKIITDYETWTKAFSVRITRGNIKTVPNKLVLNNLFPTRVGVLNLQLNSSYLARQYIRSVSINADDPTFTYEAKTSDAAAADPTTLRELTLDHGAPTTVGIIKADARFSCRDKCYTGFPVSEFQNADWLRAMSLVKDTSSNDFRRWNTFRERWKKWNLKYEQRDPLAIDLTTNRNAAYTFWLHSRFVWPSLVRKSHIKFPLTRVGNQSKVEFIVENPSDSPVILQILPLSLHPNPESITSRLSTSPHLRQAPTGSGSAGGGGSNAGSARASHSPITSLISNSPSLFTVDRIEELDRQNIAIKGSSSRYRKHIEKMLPDLKVNGRSRAAILTPGGRLKVTLGFQPSKRALVSSVFVIRNNLTVYEMVGVSGQGGEGRIYMGSSRRDDNTILLIDITEKHLKSCNDKSTGGGSRKLIPSFTVKRSFTVYSVGELPMQIEGFLINDKPCEGYGFKVLNCELFHLQPNRTKRIDLVYTPDFTMTKIMRSLTIIHNGGQTVNHTLQVTLPSHMLSRCSSALPRPEWESLMAYCTVGGIICLLVSVVVATWLEADRICQEDVWLQQVPIDSLSHPYNRYQGGAPIYEAGLTRRTPSYDRSGGAPDLPELHRGPVMRRPHLLIGHGGGGGGGASHGVRHHHRGLDYKSGSTSHPTRVSSPIHTTPSTESTGPGPGPGSATAQSLVYSLLHYLKLIVSFILGSSSTKSRKKVLDMKTRMSLIGQRRDGASGNRTSLSRDRNNTESAAAADGLEDHSPTDPKDGCVGVSTSRSYGSSGHHVAKRGGRSRGNSKSVINDSQDGSKLGGQQESDNDSNIQQTTGGRGSYKRSDGKQGIRLRSNALSSRKEQRAQAAKTRRATTGPSSSNKLGGAAASAPRSSTTANQYNTAGNDADESSSDTEEGGGGAVGPEDHESGIDDIDDNKSGSSEDGYIVISEEVNTYNNPYTVSPGAGAAVVGGNNTDDSELRSTPGQNKHRKQKSGRGAGGGGQNTKPSPNMISRPVTTVSPMVINHSPEKDSRPETPNTGRTSSASPAVSLDSSAGGGGGGGGPTGNNRTSTSKCGRSMATVSPLIIIGAEPKTSQAVSTHSGGVGGSTHSCDRVKHYQRPISAEFGTPPSTGRGGRGIESSSSGSKPIEDIDAQHKRSDFISDIMAAAQARRQQENFWREQAEQHEMEMRNLPLPQPPSIDEFSSNRRHHHQLQQQNLSAADPAAAAAAYQRRLNTTAAALPHSASLNQLAALTRLSSQQQQQQRNGNSGLRYPFIDPQQQQPHQQRLLQSWHPSREETFRTLESDAASTPPGFGSGSTRPPGYHGLSMNSSFANLDSTVAAAGGGSGLSNTTTATPFLPGFGAGPGAPLSPEQIQSMLPKRDMNVLSGLGGLGQNRLDLITPSSLLPGATLDMSRGQLPYLSTPDHQRAGGAAGDIRLNHDLPLSEWSRGKRKLERERYALHVKQQEQLEAAAAAQSSFSAGKFDWPGFSRRESGFADTTALRGANSTASGVGSVDGGGIWPSTSSWSPPSATAVAATATDSSDSTGGGGGGIWSGSGNSGLWEPRTTSWDPLFSSIWSSNPAPTTSASLAPGPGGDGVGSGTAAGGVVGDAAIGASFKTMGGDDKDKGGCSGDNNDVTNTTTTENETIGGDQQLFATSSNSDGFGSSTQETESAAAQKDQ